MEPLNPFKNLRNALILIVEDDSRSLKLLEHVIGKAGYTVSSATNGFEALSFLETNIPDVIIMDIFMPGKDGFETCKEIKQNPLTINIPVIFLTGATDIKSKIDAFKIGAADYITKPFQTAEVLTRIENQLKLKRYKETLDRYQNIFGDLVDQQSTGEIDSYLDRIENFTTKISERIKQISQIITQHKPTNNPDTDIQEINDYLNDVIRTTLKMRQDGNLN